MRIQKQKRSQKAITLIALVITAIILLILAGITIASLGGENGLIAKVNQAKKAQIEAEMKEKLTLEITELQTEKGGNATIEDITQAWIDTEITDYTCNVSSNDSGTSKEVKIEKDNVSVTFIIDENLNIIEKEIKISNIEFTYEIESSSGGVAKLLVKVTAETNISKIEMPDGYVLKDIKNKQVGFDFEAKLGKGYEYKFNIILENGESQERKISFVELANEPDISGFDKNKTYYVTWDLTSSPYTINEGTAIIKPAPSNWYDYTREINKWANVKTTGGGNDCYWVWIPRYAYKVPSRSTAGTIDIKFLDGKTNKPIDGSDITISNNTTEGSWNVHPAFWWDKDNDGIEDEGEQLTGIWVAKYEASSSSVSEATVTTDLATAGGGDNINLKVRSIPNVTSWRGITVGNIFTVCQNLTLEGHSLENTSNIDSHMMKNVEWGAVTYLSRSIYGKNSSVWNNSYAYDNTTYYSPITGLCGNSQDASQTSLTNTYKYNEAGGENASTTGNVYGIYDMAGGAWEYVAGIISSNKSNSTYYDFSDTKYTKYFDWYTNYDNTKYGDAVYETSTSSSETVSSWDNDWSQFVNSSEPVFLRGGRAGETSWAGIFSFLGWYGNDFQTCSFRPCLVNSQS